MNTVPVEMLQQIFTCDPASGVIFWKIPRRGVMPGDVAGHICKSTGYTKIMFAQRSFRAHRILWALTYGSWPEVDVDHINGNRSDNRIANLRLASRAENIRNMKTRTKKKCALKGATPYKGRADKFVAQIRIDGKQRKLGVFPTEREAHDAYCEVAVKAFGRFFNPDCSCHQSGAA
jgi:hypothetical protein